MGTIKTCIPPPLPNLRLLLLYLPAQRYCLILQQAPHSHDILLPKLRLPPRPDFLILLLFKQGTPEDPRICPLRNHTKPTGNHSWLELQTDCLSYLLDCQRSTLSFHTGSQ